MALPYDIRNAKILIVDDIESNVQLLFHLLTGAGYTSVDKTVDPREVFDLYYEHRYDVILLDLSMPYMTGFEVMEALKTIESEGYLPVLAITAEPSHKHRALQSGAKDFVTKPFDPVEVLTRLQNMLEIRLLHKQLRKYTESLEVHVEEKTASLHESERKMNYLLNFDALTGLPNRILLRDRIARAQEIAGYGNAVMGFFLVDLRRLSLIRSSLGLKVEQSVIIMLAHRLMEWAKRAELTKREDSVARFGDESFGVVAVRDTPEELASVAGEILTALDTSFTVDEQELHVESSIGISICPNDGYDFDHLIQAAEVAAQRAVESGSERYQFYMPELNQNACERLKIENDLRHALEREELLLHYQPQVDLKTGAVIGFEALIRWQHPGMGLIPPGRFIGLAEDTGLIVPIGDWVMREACRQNKAWQDAGLPIVPIAVNLSAKQFVPDIVDKVREALLASQLESHYLELELTESLSMENPESTVQILRQLKTMGVYLSIDDFGTGYSNLTYLKRFPLDKLKLDQSFVSELSHNNDDLAISRAIISMAHSLRLRVIAEGVETEVQREILCDNDCDEMQGYLFSRPIPHAECEVLLRAQMKTFIHVGEC